MKTLTCGGECESFFDLSAAEGPLSTTDLATVGSAKVGFTQASSGDYIGGVRGLVERNTMRYYLAIDAYLGSLAIPADKRVDQRFATWFEATEQYPRQLHELDRQEYQQMKKNEYQRQQMAQ